MRDYGDGEVKSAVTGWGGGGVPESRGAGVDMHVQEVYKSVLGIHTPERSCSGKGV